MLVQDILQIRNWDQYKIHVAQQNSVGTRPIDVFSHSFDEWQNGWNGNFQSRDYWNRPFIFSIIELPGRPNQWLFGGIFKVISRKHKPTTSNLKRMHYKLELEPIAEKLVGRLIIEWKKDV